jgi:tetratricopeptide (TPR) repeat protein
MDRQAEGLVTACREAIQMRQSASKAAEANHSMGLLLQHLGRHEEAMAPLREAIRLRPNYAEAHYRLGRSLLVAALADVAHSKSASAVPKLEAALQSLRDGIRLNPDHIEAYGSLGDSLRELKRHDEAIAAYREAIRLDPQNAERRIQLAEWLNKLGRYPEAVETFEAAERIDRTLIGPSEREIWESSRQGQRWKGWDEKIPAVR